MRLQPRWKIAIPSEFAAQPPDDEIPRKVPGKRNHDFLWGFYVGEEEDDDDNDDDMISN